MAHDIFISHAAEPERSVQVANAIVHELENRGVRCWIAPRDMDPGQDYMAQLLDRVSESKVLVLVFTAEANSSPNVKREVGVAFESEVPILPFRVQDVEPTRELKYCIGQVHWLDAVTPPLAAHIHELADSVEKLLAGDDEERIEEIRERKVNRRWWRAVVWTMKHGGAALGIAAVLILGVIGFIGWKATQFIAPVEQGKSQIEKILEDSTKAFTQDRRLRPVRTVDIDQQVATSFVCYYGRCGINQVSGFPEEVSKVYFGTSEDELDRFLDVEADRPLEANRTRNYPIHEYPFYSSSGSVFIQIETSVGKRRDVQEVSLQATGADYSPYGAFVRLQLEDGPSGVSDPGAMLGSRKQDSALPLYLGSPSGVESLLYAFDEGGFFDMPADQRRQGRPQVFELSLPSDAEMLRVQYELSNGETTDTFRYAMPSVEGIQEDERKRVLAENVASVVACARVTGELPIDPGPNATPQERYDAQNAQNMMKSALRSSLMQAGLRGVAVKRSDVTICAPHYLNASTAGAAGAWSAAREIEFRTNFGTRLTAPVSGGEGGSRNAAWTIEIPELARQVYARVVFTDGSKSDEVRVPVTQVELPKLQ